MNELFQLSSLEWALVIMCGMLIGMSKTGVAGAGMVVVPILAAIFGGKVSSGILLPMLSFADIVAVIYYNRHAEWKYVLRLLPWTAVGIAAGVLAGDWVSDAIFKKMMAVIVLGGAVLMIWRDLRKEKMEVPNKWWFSSGFGLAGGFATMIGNAAGSIMSIYFLSMRLPKNIFIGTGAWFFLIINLSKIPLHIVFWETINWQTFQFNLMMLPAIGLGAFLGVRLVRLIPEKPYRIFIIFITVLSSVLLFF